MLGLDPAEHLGSSPQVRGKQMDTLKTQAAERLIPAGAGKTPHQARIYPPLAAHPRRCGENGLALPC